MNKKLFKEKVLTKFPEKKSDIKFQSNELMNAAYFGKFMFYNNVYSDFIYIQYENKDFGKMEE